MQTKINRYDARIVHPGHLQVVPLAEGTLCKFEEVVCALEAEFQRGRQAPGSMPGYNEYNGLWDKVRELEKVTETAGHEVVALTEKIATLHDSHNDLGQDHMKLRQDVGRKGNLESKSLVEIMTDRDKRLFLAERAQDPARGLGALRKRVEELEGLVSANSHNTQAHHTRLDNQKTRLRLAENERGSDKVALQLQVDFHQKLVNRVVVLEKATNIAGDLTPETLDKAIATLVGAGHQNDVLVVRLPDDARQAEYENLECRLEETGRAYLILQDGEILENPREGLAGAALLEIGSLIREFKKKACTNESMIKDVNTLLNAILAAGDIQGKEPAVSRERAALDRIQGTVVGFHKSYHLATESCKGAGVGPLLKAIEAATRTGLG